MLKNGPLHVNSSYETRKIPQQKAVGTEFIKGEQKRQIGKYFRLFK